MTYQNAPDKAPSSPLAITICRELFADRLIEKLMVPIEYAAADLESRCKLDSDISDELGNQPSELLAMQVPADSSQEWLASLVMRARERPTLGQNVPDPSASLQRFIETPFLEYEMRLDDVDQFIDDVNLMASSEARPDQKAIPHGSSVLQILKPGADPDAATESWVKVYPLFGGAIVKLSPATLWDLIRLQVVKSCKPVDRVSMLDHEL